MIKKYGKSSRCLSDIKKLYFINNDKMMEKSRKLLDFYIAQPKRTSCKICNMPLNPEPSFVKLKVAYHICANCSHMNGAHEDTDDFCNFAYTDDGGNASDYRVNDLKAYDKRMEIIYLPKADFLLEALGTCVAAPTKLSYFDLGAGSGYMVKALTERTVQHVIGYEVSHSQVALGNAMMESDKLRVFNFEDVYKIAETEHADVLTLIGVLEHLQRPLDLFAAIRKNPSIQYVMISVPLVSPTVFFETVFPQVMQRHLTDEHTHLFTHKSLAYLYESYGFEPIAEWWFGLDIEDLFRDVTVMLQKQGTANDAMEVWASQFTQAIEAMQLAIDERHLSSEVHVVLKKSPLP